MEEVADKQGGGGGMGGRGGGGCGCKSNHKIVHSELNYKRKKNSFCVKHAHCNNSR